MVEPDAPLRRQLPAQATSAAQARRFIREVLADEDQLELLESAELVVSELVTNALVHAGTPIELSVRIDDNGLRVEVADGSPHFPRARDYHPTAGTGRGLRLLNEMVDRWGAEAVGAGKVVWFELRVGAAEPGDHIPEGVDSVARWRNEPGSVNVRLLNVPLLLHAAWHQHCEALLRELLLVQLDGDNADKALETHATTSEALSLLVEQVPAPDLGGEPEALMAHLTDPSVSLPSLLLRIPPHAVGNFRVLDETLEIAVQLADEGALLTAPTQPELRSLRRWICREVERQTAGDAPVAWTSNDGTNAPGIEPDWDAEQISRATTAVVAADDTARIVALSQGAADFLGYEDAEELVGRRLLEIIPPRYHQAHLAGFTLHLTTGRDMLIDRTVTVPFLRADGTERTAELVIRSQQLPGGRRGFLGELSPV